MFSAYCNKVFVLLIGEKHGWKGKVTQSLCNKQTMITQLPEVYAVIAMIQITWLISVSACSGSVTIWIIFLIFSECIDIKI